MSESKVEQTPVLVVGAGPVGLTMACELARHGVPCRIVDAGEGPTDQSRALGVQARTLEVFENVGIAAEAMARGRRVHGVTAYADARPLAHLKLDMEGLDTPYPFILVLPQSETEHLLLDRLGRHGVEVERRTKLEGFDQDESGVTAHLTGGDGRPLEVRARWLVGCDGAHSVTRKTLGLAFEGVEYEEQFLLADVKLEWDRPGDEMTIIVTEDGPIIAFPMPGPGPDRWRLVDALGQMGGDAEPDAVVARYQDLLRHHGFPDARVSDPTWTSAYRIHRRMADRFRQGRCFIAGDAGHIHSPAGGQGMNTGIQDAYNLAWKLALVDRGESPESLLDSYTPERRPVAAGVLKETDALTRMVTLHNPVAQAIRNTLIRVLGQFDFVARQISRDDSELAVNYRDSPIVAHDGRGHGVEAGDRLPNVPIERDGSRRLFDLLHVSRHVLLCFDGADNLEGVRSVAGRHSSLIDIQQIPRPADATGSAHDRLAGNGGAIYLVRPDGYVGYRASPPDPAHLETYLGRIFTTAATR